MGAQADARRQLGFIVAFVVSVLVLAQWLRGDGDLSFWAALFVALFVAGLVGLLVVRVLIFVIEVLPGLAKFLRDLSGKNG